MHREVGREDDACLCGKRVGFASTEGLFYLS